MQACGVFGRRIIVHRRWHRAYPVRICNLYYQKIVFRLNGFKEICGIERLVCLLSCHLYREARLTLPTHIKPKLYVYHLHIACDSSHGEIHCLRNENISTDLVTDASWTLLCDIEVTPAQFYPNFHVFWVGGLSCLLEISSSETDNCLCL